MGEEVDLSSLDCRVTSNDAVPEDLLVCHAKVGGLVDGVTVDFYEATRVNERIYSLSGCEFSLGVLLLDFVCASAMQRLFFELTQFLDEFWHFHDCRRVR